MSKAKKVAALKERIQADMAALSEMTEPNTDGLSRTLRGDLGAILERLTGVEVMLDRVRSELALVNGRLDGYAGLLAEMRDRLLVLEQRAPLATRERARLTMGPVVSQELVAPLEPNYPNPTCRHGRADCLVDAERLPE